MKVLHAVDDARAAAAVRAHLSCHVPGLLLEVLAGASDLLQRLPGAVHEPAVCDVLLLDFRRSGAQALEVLRTLRKDRELDLPVVLVVAAGDAEVLARASESGATKCVVEHPGYLFELPAALESAYDRVQLLRERRALRESEAFVRSVLDSLTAQVAVLDEAGTIVAVNASWREFALKNGGGEAAAHPIGANYLDYCQAAEAGGADTTPQAEREGIRAVLEGRLAQFKLEYPCNSPEEERWFVMNVSRTPGRRGGATIAHEDITVRKQIEHTLRESERRYRELVSAVPGAVYTFRVDAQGRRSMPFVSEGIRDLTGLSPAQVMADAELAFGLIPAEAIAAMEQSIFASLQALSPWVHEFPIRTPGGEEKWLRGQSMPRREADGATVWHGVFIEITERKRAEEALLLNQSNLRAIAENTLAGITVLQDGRRVFANARAAEIFGYTLEEFLPLAIPDVVHPDSRDMIMDRARGRAAGEQLPPRIEFTGLAKDGRAVPVEAHYALATWNGLPAVIVFFLEIAERKATERILQLLSTGMAHLSGASYFNEIAVRVAEYLEAEIGFVHRFLKQENPRVRTFGLSVDGQVRPAVEFELAGTPCEEVRGGRSVVLPGNLQQAFPAFRLAVDLGASGYAAAPLFDRHGDPIGVVGVMSRTRLRQPDERIRSLLQLFAVRAAAEIDRLDAEARFRDLFEHSPDGSIIVNQAGMITAANRTAQSLFGYSAAELIGQSVDILVPEPVRKGHPGMRRHFHATATSRAMGSGKADLRARRRDGTTFPADIDLHPLETEDDHLVVATVRDMTAYRQAEDERLALELQLRQSQKMEAVGTLAGGVAHDFNNIIGTILGNAELARQDVGAEHPALESIEEIGKAGRRARDLVQQILAFSRKQPLAKRVIAPGPVVGETLKLLRATLPAHVELELSCPAGLPNISADTTQIQQVLMNLCTNAWYAMEGRPGRIDIALQAVVVDAALAARHADLRAGKYVRLSVRDTGKGMDAETLERIFEPFYTTKPVDEGTGLGLSVVHGIMQAHGGGIAVESAPWVGTNFDLYFPAVDVPVTENAVMAVASAPPDAGRRHVLYLDDDEALVLLVSRMLERQGYRVSGYTQAREALEAVRADPGGFDLVVSDFNMPGMSGLDVASELARIRPDLPVAVTSGYITDELRERAPQAGVRHLIYKPNTVEELCDAVRRLTEPVN